MPGLPGAGIRDGKSALPRSTLPGDDGRAVGPSVYAKGVVPQVGFGHDPVIAQLAVDDGEDR